MKKVSDLDKKTETRIKSDVWNAAHALGESEYSETEGLNTTASRALSDALGLCANCKCLSYCRTEWGNVFAGCSSFDIKLPYGNRMTECTNFDERGTLSLNTMLSMAVLIDINKKEIGILAKSPKGGG